MISHRSLASHCDLVRRHYQISCEDRVLQFADCTADVSVEQIFTTLITGATLILRDNDLWPVEVFQRKIAELNLSVIDLPPPIFINGPLRKRDGFSRSQAIDRDWLLLAETYCPPNTRLYGASQIPRKSFC